MNVEVLDQQKNIRIDAKQIKKITTKFLKHLKQPKDCILNLIFVSPYRIKQLNKKYFKKNRVTDVIAIEPGKFDREIFSSYLGDITICPQKAKENSKRFNTSLKNEVSLYIAHGILHLLGYDDLKEKDRKKMERKQQELMGTFCKVPPCSRVSQ